MSNCIYLKEGYVKVNYKPETKVLYINWKNLFDSNVVRECCTKQLQQVRSGAKVMVVDISKAKGVLSDEIQSWFQESLFGMLAEAGLKVIITIDAQMPVTRLSSMKWTKTGTNFSFDMITVNSKEDASKAAMKYI